MYTVHIPPSSVLIANPLYVYGPVPAAVGSCLAGRAEFLPTLLAD
jgi:hypothetical protein